MVAMAEPGSPALQPPMICVADVDTRLTCSTTCGLCPLYVRDRRAGERRSTHRRTPDRRVLNRL